MQRLLDSCDDFAHRFNLRGSGIDHAYSQLLTAHHHQITSAWSRIFQNQLLDVDSGQIRSRL